MITNTRGEDAGGRTGVGGHLLSPEVHTSGGFQPFSLNQIPGDST